MKSNLRIFFLCSACLLGAPALGWAADYEPPIVVDQAPEFVPVEVGSGWYLRGDVTYSFNESPFEAFGDIGFDVDHVRFGGGVGVGYHFTDMVRGDVTLNFLSSDEARFESDVFDARLENQVWTGMANAYVDLGTYSGLTPYLGAGLGIMYSRNTSELTGFGFIDEVTDTQSEFAYALMAGVSYKVGTNSSIDVGYQFVSSPGTEFADPSSFEPDEGLDYHQIKVGFRYDLW
ncbi:MAG: outer membrane protein [Mesorhizobium sp.]|jgi:opacity protein-like surface antigen